MHICAVLLCVTARTNYHAIFILYSGSCRQQETMADTWSYHSVILTPTNPPPPPSTLTQRGTTLFNRVLQALRVRGSRGKSV